MAGNKQEGATTDRQIAEFALELQKTLRAFGIAPLDEEQRDRLAAHYAMMLRWNRHTNLTRITSPAEAARLHYGESIFAAQFAGEAAQILDIGSGAGFPALPFAVMRPMSQVTALEAHQKKALFLYEVKDALRLANFQVARARLEAFDLSPYDLLTSRAIERADDVMPRLLEHLGEHQRLLLCGAPALVEHLQKTASRAYRVEIHMVPEAEARLVALFSR